MLGQKQNPRREWRRAAPPFSSWVLCPHTLGDSYKTEKASLVKNYLGFSLKVLSSFVK